jgi:hypothetical protein
LKLFRIQGFGDQLERIIFLNFTCNDVVFYLSVLYAAGLLVYLPAVTLPILTMVEETPFLFRFIYKDVPFIFNDIQWNYLQEVKSEKRKKLLRILVVTVSGLDSFFQGDFLGIIEIIGSLLNSILALVLPILMNNKAFGLRRLS